MNLKELKAMIKEEWEAHQNEQALPSVAVSDADVDATGGDDENAKASIESDVIKLKEKEIDTLSEKIVDAEARFEKIKKILEGGVTARERRDLRRLGIEAPSGLKAKQNANYSK